MVEVPLILVGAVGGVLTVTLTGVLDALSQPVELLYEDA
jgi:hypothetical protein